MRLSLLVWVSSLLSSVPALGSATSPRSLLVRTSTVMFSFLEALSGVAAMVLRQRESLV